MRYFRGEDEVLEIERRAHTRVLAYCPADLRTPSGCRSGQLTNISAGGVRMQLTDPPRTGATVLLEWKSFQSFCKVVWSTKDACGLAFERPVAQSVVVETSGQEDGPPQPEADLRNIVLGTRHPLRPGRPGLELGKIRLGARRGFGLKDPG